MTVAAAALEVAAVVARTTPTLPELAAPLMPLTLLDPPAILPPTEGMAALAAGAAAPATAQEGMVGLAGVGVQTEAAWLGATVVRAAEAAPRLRR